MERKMELDLGKLFIGGISWDTDESRLKEYFEQYGEVVEAVIMRDRITGRARGFGFIVFADASVAERVVMDKHMIDGRTVEAKKAVPRDDQQVLNKSNHNIIQGSPGLGRTKKIFVGGLASTVTESDFKNYFDQFGLITDVVVMYDHNTKRPRGFGFITFDSEDAVDSVLHRTFHELNGKMVEVKKAVPKELSPSPSRSPLIGYTNYGMNRASSFFINYTQGYNLNSIAGYGRLNPLVTGQTGLPPFGNPGYGMSMNIDAGYGANSHLTNSQGYGRVLGPYYSGNSNRYSTPIGFNVGNSRGDSLMNSTTRNVWGNGSFPSPTNPPSPGAILGSDSSNFGVSFGNSGTNWGTASTASQGGSNSSGYRSGHLGYDLGESYGLEGGSYGRTHSTNSAPVSTFASSTSGFGMSYGGLYPGDTGFGDSTWRSSSPELDRSGSFSFHLGNAAAVVASRTSEGIIGSFSTTNRQANRGIAA